MSRLLLICLSSLLVCYVNAQNLIDLSGSWQFAIDRQDVGIKEHWYQKDLDDYIYLPGSMPENGKGDNPTLTTQWIGSLYDSSFYFNPEMEPYRRAENIGFPFFLTPKKHYVGTAWYRRTVYVPQSWGGERVLLYLERPHIETTVYVNGERVGHQNSLSTPHEFDISDYIFPGQRNTLAIRVYNGIDGVGVGQDSHSVTDQTQGDWNGITGRMELQLMPHNVWIQNVKVFPNIFSREVSIKASFGSRLRFFDTTPYIHLILEDPDGHAIVDEEFLYESDDMDFSVTLHDIKVWDEFRPNLYHLTLSVNDQDSYETDFGMRNINVRDRQIYLNGHPIFLRGTVENCTFPLTGYPPTDEREWLRIFQKCKEYGLNHVRFHSYCPPEAAFVAADHTGMYLQVEGPTWPNHGVKLGQGMTIDKYLMAETQRILDTYGNHPSFLMMAAGNEPAGNWVPYTNDWVKKWSKEDPRRLYCGASVGGGWQWDDQSQYHVKGGGRGLNWNRHAPSSDDDYLQDLLHPRNYKGPEDCNSPIIAHEQGQWCAFPDLKEINKYTGVTRARNFEIFRDLLKQHGMEEQGENFLMASGKLQTLCYKYEIERNLRTPDYAGFQLLGLNDYSGQGTAVEGILNVFWQEKGYCTANEWSQWCAPVVPLARFPKFVYSDQDTLCVPVEVYNAHYGKLSNIEPLYTITNERGDILHSGQLAKRDIPVGKNTSLGTIILSLSRFTEPIKLTLTVAAARDIHNSWDFWVYPNRGTEEEDSNYKDYNKQGIYIADTLDETGKKVLSQGGKVLLTAAGKIKLGSDVRQTYLPVFWNTSWFKMRPPHTTGAYIEVKHPLFQWFPSDSWTNLNWWELLNNAQVMNLTGLPKEYQSPIQPIDTWHLSRKLGMVLEANVSKGRLFMTTMDIKSDLNHRLVARQMRHAILQYIQSDKFNPSLSLSIDEIGEFFTREAPKVDMHTKESPDELKPKFK
ncbi:MAG: beta-glucuronidase [Bacteroidaceae bacterium]|nr:beta-glucuronidase [Bacteroidaceae bacterium]